MATISTLQQECIKKKQYYAAMRAQAQIMRMQACIMRIKALTMRYKILAIQTESQNMRAINQEWFIE